jgi:hypothetical protein
MPIAIQRITKRIQTHETIGRLLLGNGIVKMLRQQYRLRFPWDPCKMVIRERIMNVAGVGVENSGRE